MEVHIFGDDVYVCLNDNRFMVVLNPAEAEILSKALATAVTEIAGRQHTRQMFEPID